MSSGFQTAGKIRGRLKTHVERKKREPFVRKKRGRLGCKRTVSSELFWPRARPGVAWKKTHVEGKSVSLLSAKRGRFRKRTVSSEPFLAAGKTWGRFCGSETRDERTESD